MTARTELFSKIAHGPVEFAWEHKGPLGIVAVMFGLTYALSFLGESRRINTSSILTTPQPTPELNGLGGGGEGMDQLGLSDTASEGCVSIHNLPQGRQTTWSALDELSARNGWLFPREGSVVLMHRFGDREGPFSVQEALQTKSLVHNGDAWCSNP